VIWNDFDREGAVLLDDKVAVIYGAGGGVGGAVARSFAAEGATVHAVGRDGAALRKLADEIGLAIEAAEVDAFDEDAVDADIRSLIERHGRIDVSFNLIGVDHVQGIPLIDMTAEQFVKGIEDRLLAHFITARAAARAMAARGSGVILMLTATPDRVAIPNAGSFGVQCAAVESFTRALAVEVGNKGVRVCCLRSAGSPDAAGVDEVFDMHAENAGLTRDEFDDERSRGTLLGRLPRLGEVGRVATFLASDWASAMTGTITNVTCGELLD
jgi:3-oxoacyl-[acyl-carrier protein] reductase